MTARRQRVEELLADHATTYMDQDGEMWDLDPTDYTDDGSYDITHPRDERG